MQTETIKSEISAITLRRGEIYDRLISLATEQQAILVAGRNYEDLRKNLTKFDPLILDLKKLDRQEDALARYVERVHAGVQIRRHPEFRPAYQTDGSDVTSKAERLRALTECNSQLLDNLMSFINYSVGIVCKAASAQGTAVSGSSPSLFFDLKA